MSEPVDARAEPAPAGIDPEPVSAWLAARVDDLEPPLRFDLITGGHSNLTFRVTDQGGRRWVLRRPPLKQVLATAHDMGREHRIIAALTGTDVPVPPLVGLCADSEVNGAPFYVMDFVDGLILRDAAIAEQLSEAERAAASHSLMETLAAIHTVDIDAVGLGDLGKREDYLARQLRRWYGQFEKSKLREIPVVDEVHAELVRRQPPQQRATIVHGDYKFENCLVDRTGTVRAVLDWELCTLGDPLADLGVLLVYSPGPDDARRTGIASATTLPGFPSPAELVARYAARSGLDVSNVDYYVAFGFWKLACITEGVYARYVGGAMGDRDPAMYELLGQHVVTCAERASELLDGAS